MKVERKSYGQRILDSFVVLLIGFLLFIGSFIVLFVNEGRENFANYALKATVFDQTQTYETDDLVYIVGNLSATTYASDTYLKANDYIYIERIVEMYAYVEYEHTQTREKLGGSTETVYTYTYQLEWTQSPKKSNTYQGDDTEKPKDIPANYDSWIDSMPKNDSDKAKGVTINGINVANGFDLSGAKQLSITKDDVQNLTNNETVVDNMIYRANNGSADNPKLGDIRIRYIAIKASDKGLLLARFNNNQFEPFLTKKGSQLYRFFAGVESQSEAVKILNSEYKASLWLLRIVGFIMMFIGLLLIGNPVTTLISVIPIFAKIGRNIYAILALIISLVLTSLTVIIAMIFNNVYLAIATVVILILIVVLVLQSKKKKATKKTTKSKK